MDRIEPQIGNNKYREKALDEKFCSDCGDAIKAKAEICPKCGVRQIDQINTLASIAPNGKSKIAAALFALLLGAFGAHKFYLGQIGLGFVYLLFFWTLIPGLVAIIEFVLLLTMKDDIFNRRFGQI